MYVVLEAQYQSALSGAVQSLNSSRKDVCFEVRAATRQMAPAIAGSFHPWMDPHELVVRQVVGYLLEELRDAKNLAEFEKDVSRANIFIASLIFIEELADKVRQSGHPVAAFRSGRGPDVLSHTQVVAAVAPHREKLDACLVFPSMPAVMRLNKLGRRVLLRVAP